ncbi:MAG: heme lyase CcmF/NrfE family subunit [Alphaproteobacteria bacterium]
MIAEIGHFALILALLAGVFQATVPLVGAHRGDRTLISFANPVAFLQLGLAILAFAMLTWGYLVSDFSIANVYFNSHTQKPLLYKITGVWGNHEGSILLWILILTVFGAAVAAFGRDLPAPFRARVLAVQAMVTVGFVAFSIFTSNPFARVDPAPLEGTGLNPLLQDPGLAFHPPMLYLGYVGFSIAFSFAVAALIEGKVDAAWARWVRPWTLAAWMFLTAGIMLGSWWAYYELGWGGWWFWDPVENASFMPWLAGTALLHSAIVVEKRDTLKSWTILLAILTFSLSLLGTFIVRSGVLTSVHAFATDPERGVFILGFLILVVGGSLALYAVRAGSLKPGGMFAPISRETSLVMNNLVLAVMTFVVLFGTLFPLFANELGYQVSVAAPYFNIVFPALMAILVPFMVIGPLLAWKRGDLGTALRRLTPSMIAGVLAGIAVAATTESAWWAPVAIGYGTWLMVAILTEFAGRIALGRVSIGQSLNRAAGLPRGAWGMMLAHLGIAVMIFGIAVSSAYERETITIKEPGDMIAVGGYDFSLDAVGPIRGPNYAALRATFSVYKDGEFIARLYPETRHYANPPDETTEAAIYPLIEGDLYAVIGERQSTGGWGVRLYHKPMIWGLWVGTALMVLGGLFSLSDRRLRVGAPRRARSPKPARAPAE